LAKVIERVQAHYEVLDVELGKVYRWHPESVVVECYCGKEPTLTASKNACSECGVDHRAIIEEVLDASPGDEEVYHPWRNYSSPEEEREDSGLPF
jgi:hypothetical protein